MYSEVGIGTTFKIYLPRKSEIVNGTQNSPVISTKTEGEIIGGTEKILVVDDEDDLADIAKSILEEYGYRVLVAHRGTSALKVLDDEHDIDLLLSDVIMPGMNGFELAELAIRKNPSIKILISSGFTGNISKIIKQNRNEFPMLRKPYSNRELAAEVRRILYTPDA